MSSKDLSGRNHIKSIEDYNYASSNCDFLIEANVELAHLNEKADDNCLDIFERLVKVVEYRDDSTGRHPERVGVLSARIALRLGAPTSFVEDIFKAAQLHDLGKIAIPDTILLKRSRLTTDEHKVMQRHCEVGSDMLSGSEFPLLQMAQDIAIAHHEKLDGSGYPNQLIDEEIPLAAKIVAVADIYDALCNRRPYKEPWEEKEAVQLLISKRDSHFDSNIIDAFLDVLGHENSGYEKMSFKINEGL